MIHRDGEMLVLAVAHDANADDVPMPRQQAKRRIMEQNKIMR